LGVHVFGYISVKSHAPAGRGKSACQYIYGKGMIQIFLLRCLIMFKAITLDLVSNISATLWQGQASVIKEIASNVNAILVKQEHRPRVLDARLFRI
jgi:hypothetical protein